MKTARLKNIIASKLYGFKGKKKPAAKPPGTAGRIDRELNKTVSLLQGIIRGKK